MLELLPEILLTLLSDPVAIALIVCGVALGMVLGAIPGVSSTMAMAILLPFTFGMDTTNAIVFLIAVFLSSVYGGSISAILIGIPGTPASIFTQVEGYPMTRQCRAGEALGLSLFASTVGGAAGLVLLILLAPMLASVATNFRSPEFAAVALFGLVMLSFSTQGSTLVAIAIGAIGLLIGMVGFDPLTDAERFTLGLPGLQAGIGLIPLIIGLFGLAEILRNLGNPANPKDVPKALGRIFPSIRGVLAKWPAMLRGSAVGTFIGAIPAAGSAVAVSIAYAQEQRFSRERHLFGSGARDGLVAPEAANSASVGGSLIPMMALGVPGDTITAVLMGALLIHGLQPGPLLFADNPGFVASVYAAVLLSLVAMMGMGLLMIRSAIWVTRIPPQLMMLLIAIFCLIGAFAIRNDINDVYVMIASGLVGYAFHLLKLPVTPLAFGLILGPILEENLRRSLMLSDGSWSVFIERPITLTLLILSASAVLAPVFTAALKGMRHREG